MLNEKAKLTRAPDAEVAINYRENDFVIAAREWTNGTGVNVG